MTSTIGLSLPGLVGNRDTCADTISGAVWHSAVLRSQDVPLCVRTIVLGTEETSHSSHGRHEIGSDSSEKAEAVILSMPGEDLYHTALAGEGGGRGHVTSSSDNLS